MEEYKVRPGGGAHTFIKAIRQGLRVRIWPKPANALPMAPPAKVLSLCFQSEGNLDPEACKLVVLRAVLTILNPPASLLLRVVSPLARPSIPFSTGPAQIRLINQTVVGTGHKISDLAEGLLESDTGGAAE